MKRRDFVQLCAASAAGAALPDASQAATLTARKYPRAKLVDEKGQALRVATLAAGTTYVFEYPYAATPAFLLRLGAPVSPRAARRHREARDARAPGRAPRLAREGGRGKLLR